MATRPRKLLTAAIGIATISYVGACQESSGNLMPPPEGNGGEPTVPDDPNGPTTPVDTQDASMAPEPTDAGTTDAGISQPSDAAVDG